MGGISYNSVEHVVEGGGKGGGGRGESIIENPTIRTSSSLMHMRRATRLLGAVAGLC